MSSTPLKPAESKPVVSEMRLDSIVDRSVAAHKSKIDMDLSYKEMEPVHYTVEKQIPVKTSVP